MRRTVGYAAIWCGATALAVSIAWLGVRDVLRNEVFHDVTVDPVTAAGAAFPRPEASSGTVSPSPAATTSRATTPEATRAPVPEATSTGATRKPVARSTPSPVKTSRKPVAGPTTPERTPTATAPQAAPDEKVEVVTLKGGQVAFGLGARTCRLISAMPIAGYEAKVAQAEGWVRVDLVQGEHGSAAFCTTNGFAPATDTWEY